MPTPQRKSEQSQSRLVDAWHPNFRNRERLPDTKVVRTFFFVNVASVTVVLCLALGFWYQEYHISSLTRQVADWQAQIATNQKGAADAVTLSGEFADEEKKIREVDEFLQQRLTLPQFMFHLGSTLPSDLVIDAVDVRESGVNLRGTAAGSPIEAAGRTSAYVDLLQQDVFFRDLFETKDIKQDMKRDQTSGRVTFEISLRFKGRAKK